MARFTLRQLTYFCKLCESGTFSKAAKELNLSQPALHYQLNELEAILEVELVRRSPQGVTVTAAGVAFYAEAVKVLEQCTVALDSIAPFQPAADLPLVVGFAPSPGRMIGPEMLLELRGRGYANISVRDGLSADLARLVVTGTIDCALCYRTPALRLLRRRYHVANENMYLIGPKQVVGPKTDPIAFAELAHYRFVLDSPVHTTRHIIDAVARTEKVSLDITFEVDSIDMKKNFIEDRGFCTIAPAIFVAEGIRDGRLGARRIEGPAITREVMLCISDNVAPHRARELLDVSRALIGRISEDDFYGWSLCPASGAERGGA